jgi:type 1 glutamine amidotransferase
VVNQTVHVEIADPGHPITAGLKPWEMIDETYVTDDADDASQILLTTDHPQSMRTIAWTRSYGSSRVFCYQSGHDGPAFANPSFRTVLARGIQWVARKI